MSKNRVALQGVLGECCTRTVFIGFAPANLLCCLSFADVLDERTGAGYQRRFSPKHSEDFRRYLQQEGSATIPLTFNLRPECKDLWHVQKATNGLSRLTIASQTKKVLAQVDCQHRLGSISDLNISLPYMTFIGLSLREEMQIFNVINAKAKGLSSSLLDFHESKLRAELAAENPQLYIALRLNEDLESPWRTQLDLGGNKTLGLNRRASLRTMQNAVKRFLATSRILDNHSPDAAFDTVLSFWKAITGLLEREWKNPRKHLLTKGVGVYALMSLAGTICSENPNQSSEVTEGEFRELLSPWITRVNWSSEGELKGFGGETGAQEAFGFLDQLRKNAHQPHRTNA